MATALIGSAAPPADASTFLAMGLSELCQRATLVVAATPVHSTVVWEDSAGGRGRRIVTYTRVRVDRIVDGTAPAELWIRTLGGSIGDIGQRVDGEAILAPGQPSLFFLRRMADGPHGVVGMSQGQFLLDGGAVGPDARVRRFPTSARLLSKPLPPAGAGAASIVEPTLEGKTLEQAAQLIRATRAGHAP